MAWTARPARATSESASPHNDEAPGGYPGRASRRRGSRDERCELAAQQFPGGCVGELADEDHRVRGLGRPQPGPGELTDLVGRQLRVLPEHDERTDLLAPL